MPIRYTSLIALKELEKQLGGLRLEVYCAIRAWDAVERGPGPSIEDLAKALGRKESSVCGRLGELHLMGLITHGPIKTNDTGKQAQTYVALEYREPEPLPVDFDRKGQGYLNFQHAE